MENTPAHPVEPSSELSFEDHIKYSWDATKQNFELVKFADTKAGLLLALMTPFTLLSANTISTNSHHAQGAGIAVAQVFVLVALVTFAATVFACLMTIKPRGNENVLGKDEHGNLVLVKKKQGFVHNTDIVEFDKGGHCVFISRYKALTSEQRLEELLYEAWRVAHVGQSKYRWLAWAFRWTFVSASCTLIAWGIYLPLVATTPG